MGGTVLKAFSGLRARLLAMVLLALLPAAVLLAVYATVQNGIAAQSTRDDVLRLAQGDASSLQGLISQTRASLVTYSSSQAVQEQDWKTAQATAERILSEQPEYLNIGVVAPDGRLLVSALPASGTVDLSDRSYFRRAIRYRRFAVGDYVVDRVSGRPSVNVAYPVLDAAGAVGSVTYVSLDVRQLGARMSAASASSPFREYLVDSTGTVVVRLPDAVGVQGTSIAGTTLMSAILSDPSGSMSARVADDTTLEFALRPVFEEPGGGLFLALGVSPEELFAASDRVFDMTLAGFAFVALAALTAAWAAGTAWVYLPTRKLKEAATKIGRGKLSARAHLSHGSDEFIELGRQFDAMAENIERGVEFSSALAEVNRLVHSTLEFDEVMGRIISVTSDAVGTETAAIVMRENGLWFTRYSYNFPQEIIGVVLTDEQAPHAATALRTGHPVAIDDAYNDPRLNREVMESYGIRSVLTMPLIVQDEVIGVLFMNHHSKAVEFNQAQVDFAESVAATVALALHNARLYEGEHRIAETLQQALLALPETIPHLRFAHIYRSATEAARVGGDFYDLFEIEHGLVGVAVGDMSGKGLDAAALTSLVKNIIRAQAMDVQKSPAEVMRVVNSVLLRESEPEMFATVLFGVLDTATGRLVYCNAGHTTAAVGRPGAAMVRLPSNSTLVGALPEAVFADSEAQMHREDLLFLYTDGLTEAHGEGGMFGEDRVFGILEGLEGGDPWIAATRVVQEAGSFAGGHLSDDLAILAVALTER
jgi:serine phosphatase RsbU (regulator of sigma subunit)/HAMP domain-containing protein